MGDVWLDAPRVFPFRCHRRLSDGGADGPFFEEAFEFSSPDAGDGRVSRLYHSAAWIREVCGRPGSPFDVVDKGELERLGSRVEELEGEREELRARVAELESEPRVSAPPVDVEGLAGSLIDRMDGRYARRPGPKKGRSAA